MAGPAPTHTADDTSEATAAVSIPDDVIPDILSRTPLKSVCRFQCVSKRWRDLISDPAFLAVHKSRHTDPFLVDTGCFRENFEKHDLRLMDMDGNIVRVFEGAGGLGMFPTTSLDKLISVWDGSCEGVHHGDESCQAIHVVDPATGEVLFTIPGHEAITMHEHFPLIDYYKIFGIGRATPSGVYKVVRLVSSNTCDILTLGQDTTRWRRKTRPPLVPSHVPLDLGCSPVTINGVMYFLTKGTSDVTLFCFDLENEQWKDNTIEGPQTIVGAEIWSTSTISIYITELNGSLCLVQEERIDGHTSRHPRASCNNVWILDDFEKNNNWTKLCTIPVGPLGRCCMPLWRMQDGQKLLVQCGTTYKRSTLALQVYDLCTEKFSNITGEPGYLPSNIALCNLHLEQLVLTRN